jgi:hypothetical protein
LLQEFVRLRKEQERVRDAEIASGQRDKDDIDLPLPTIPYVRNYTFLVPIDLIYSELVEVPANYDPTRLLRRCAAL